MSAHRRARLPHDEARRGKRRTSLELDRAAMIQRCLEVIAAAHDLRGRRLTLRGDANHEHRRERERSRSPHCL
jgi:hypothetical protein